MKWVVGNWKSNGALAQNDALLQSLLKLPQEKVRVGVCVPFPYLAQAQAQLQGSQVLWGAQNVSPFAAGAYTGEVHAEMLKEFGCRLAIVGHSERRQYFGETNAMIAEKIARLNAAGITPIWCIGETLAERERGAWQAVLRQQIVEVVDRIGASAVSGLLIAYEPVWAIGTGRNATAADVAAAHAWVREVLASFDAPSDVPILYGGSVKGSNAAELFAVEGCDGGLIGGASLVAEEFAAIVAAANKEW
jgi:triosephosphate isomerase